MRPLQPIGQAIVAVLLFIVVFASAGNAGSTDRQPLPELDTVDDCSPEEWYDIPDEHLQGSIGHVSEADSAKGFYKYFSTYNGQPYYYNYRHGFYVLLPDEIGYNQSGEFIIGAHGNEFHNSDTTIVISVGGYFYDVMLADYPDFADSVFIRELDFLASLGQAEELSIVNDTITALIRIDHNTHKDMRTDYYLSKCVRTKDIDDRECTFDLGITFTEARADRLSEFRCILSLFPANPFNRN